MNYQQIYLSSAKPPEEIKVAFLQDLCKLLQNQDLYIKRVAKNGIPKCKICLRTLIFKYEDKVLLTLSLLNEWIKDLDYPKLKGCHLEINNFDSTSCSLEPNGYYLYICFSEHS